MPLISRHACLIVGFCLGCGVVVDLVDYCLDRYQAEDEISLFCSSSTARSVAIRSVHDLSMMG